MKEPDENVIIRFLTGCCSDQELEEVRDWINASEDNAAELFRLEEMYRRMSGLTMSGREVEKALTSVHTRIRRARAREVSMMRIIRYAAAALVLVMMSAGMWYLGGGMGKLGATDYIVAKASINTPREVTLDDSTHVWLNAGSSLRYPKTFDGEVRRVELHGEGYFEVAKDKTHPFIVSGGAVDVKVLGTVFDFDIDSDRKMAEVSLIEGSVEVTERHSSGKVMLTPGQKACVDYETGHIMVKNADVRLEAVWHNRLIPFYNADVRQIANTLEQLYGVKIVVDAGIDGSRTYSGQIMHKNDIDSVLELLKNTLPVSYRKDGGKIYLVPNE